jgi:hypothetical protein
MSERSWRFTPRTARGWWAVGLIVATPILFVLGSSLASSLYEAIPAGRTIPTDIAARPAVALTMLAGMVAGALAFLLGLLAIARQKENGLLAYASTVVGGLFILFLVAEVAFPH